MSDERDREIVVAELTKLAAKVRRHVADEIAQAIGMSAARYPDWQQRDVVYDMERLAREIGQAASQPDICRRCFHTAHEDVGECRACYCRSERTDLEPK